MRNACMLRAAISFRTAAQRRSSSFIEIGVSTRSVTVMISSLPAMRFNRSGLRLFCARYLIFLVGMTPLPTYSDCCLPLLIHDAVAQRADNGDLDFQHVAGLHVDGRVAAVADAFGRAG